MAQYRSLIQYKQVYDVCKFKGALRQNIKESNLEQYINDITALDAQRKANGKSITCYKVINTETKEVIFSLNI